MLKILYAVCLDLSPAILAQSILEKRVAARNREKFTKIPIFWGFKVIQGIDVNIPKKLVASACYDKQHVRAYLQPFSR